MRQRGLRRVRVQTEPVTAVFTIPDESSYEEEEDDDEEEEEEEEQEEVEEEEEDEEEEEEEKEEEEESCDETGNFCRPCEFYNIGEGQMGRIGISTFQQEETRNQRSNSARWKRFPSEHTHTHTHAHTDAHSVRSDL